MINTDKYEGHTPAPWVWNDDWCSALIGLPNKEADIYDENAQTVISVNTDNTPICNSLYIDEHGVKHEAFPEEQLKNNALRSEDALLIADAPLLLEEVKRLVLVADELYLHIVGEPHMTLDELVEMMWWRDEE